MLLAAARVLARLDRNHHRLDRLLRTLLDRLTVGEGEPLKLRATECRMEDIVQEVIADNEAMLAGRVTLDGQAAGWWDRDALFRVVENLLVNAVKYGDREATIACRIGRAPDGLVRLEVANQGRPIPLADWETIFLPFARGERGLQLAVGDPIATDLIDCLPTLVEGPVCLTLAAPGRVLATTTRGGVYQWQL